MEKNGDNTSCWKCKKLLKSEERVSFRTLCPHCDAYLHCCKNCKFYSPGMPNDCKVPGTEPISDREAGNYCDEFSPKSNLEKTSNGSSDAFKNLFKSRE